METPAVGKENRETGDKENRELYSRQSKTLLNLNFTLHYLFLVYFT